MPAHAPSLSRSRLAGLRILVVDDTADTLRLLSFVLERYGAEVLTASSAAEAFEQVTRQAPDVLVSDIGMPGEDGYSLMRRIRALEPERGGQIPALACTGFSWQYDRGQSLAAGFQAHLAKPIDLTALVHEIAHLAGR